MNIGFIGGGNMATALIGGLADAGEPVHIRVHEPDAARASALAERFDIALAPDNLALVKSSEVVVLAVKPQIARDVVRSVAQAFAEQHPLLISIAAGIRAASLLDWLGGEAAVVRAMPNTPALVGEGISGLFATPHVSAPQRETAQQILSGVGETLWVTDEEQIDAVTAVSGSGPAYFFLVMDALSRAGEKLGLPESTARRLAVTTARGAGVLASRSEAGPAQLRAAVTSPGGTTQRAVQVLEDGGLAGLIESAVAAACQRAVEMADEFGTTEPPSKPERAR